MKRTLITLVFLIIPFLSVYLAAEEVQTTGTISITSFGGKPDMHTNLRMIMARAINYCKAHPGTRLTFPKGRYDFAPASDGDYVMKMNGLKNCIIDGQGSEFVFHGRCAVSHIVNCSGLTLKNFSVDWDRPFISQCTIERVGGGYLDVSIDKEKYPYVIQGDTILFKANNMPFAADNWALPVAPLFNNLYDKDSRNILYGTVDNPLGDIFHKRVSVLSNGFLRFFGQHNGYNPPVGSVQSLYHGTYIRNCFDVGGSKDITFRNIPVYHCLSMTVVGVRSENITMDGIGPRVNYSKGRYFSTISDAFHFINCKGLILLENCACNGQGDDMLNVCGAYLKVLSKTGTSTVTLDRSSYTEAGDTVWLVNNKTYTRGETRVVKSISNSGNTIFMTFDKALPEDLGEGWLIENKTWTPDVTVRHCKILHGNRARGLLLDTPGKVLIENNYFSTAGTAILFGSYMEQWKESGPSENVEIRNNTFDNCFTSPWGAAIISLEAPIAPASIGSDTYHNNVRIHDNTFRSFGTPIVSATGAGSLVFSRNKIIKTTDYPALSNVEAGVVLNACRKAVMRDNNWDADYTYTKVKTYNMAGSDLSNITDYRTMLREEAAKDGSQYRYGTKPGFIADKAAVDSYTDIMTRAKQQAATATQLSAKTLLESLIKARKALDTAAVVPLTTGWYYILAADSASLSTERRTALLSAEGAKEPAWQEAADRDWHYVWHITRLDTAASLCDVRGPLFAVKNYATGLCLDAAALSDSGQPVALTSGQLTPQFFLPLDKAGHFALTNLSDGEMPALFLSRTDNGATVLGRATRGGDAAWRLERIPQDIINGIHATTVDRKSGKVDAYSLDGTLVSRGQNADETTENLSKGIYIIGGKKVLVK